MENLATFRLTALGFQGGLVHEASHGEVGEEETVEFLAHELGRLGAQDPAPAAQVGLEFAERGLDFPALLVEGRQLVGGGLGVVLPGGTSGADLGRAPDLPVLYTSGDSGDTLFRHAQLSAPAAAGKEETVSVGRLLVVDDDPGFGELVRKVGLKLDFEVEVASNGKEFTRAYDSFDPTVVVLDMVMPDVEGIELIQWLGDRGADLHLIVVTGYTPRYATLAKKLAEAKGLRSVAALSKPVRLSELQASLKRTVEA